MLFRSRTSVLTDLTYAETVSEKSQKVLDLKNIYKMSQDITADALNMMRNAKKVGKNEIEVKIVSNLLIEVLKIMKQKEAIKGYKINLKTNSIKIRLGTFFECKSIKPRSRVGKKDIEKYKRRYLPARNLGTILISTNKGLLTHEEAEKEGIGGCLIAFFY